MTLRKTLFRLCLEVNDDSQNAFAKRLGLTPMAVSRFLSGHKSERIRKEVDKYIGANLSKIKDRLDQFKLVA